MLVNKLIGGALLAAVAAAPVAAQTPSRVDRLKETGTITLGAPEASIPFAFLDQNQQAIGYTVDICKAVAKIVADDLGIKNLTIRHRATTSSTRLPLIQNGTIDLECGNTTNNAARKQQVEFAPTTFVSQVVLAARKDTKADVNDLSTFAGKTVSATAGGQTFKVAASISAAKGYDIKMAGAPDMSRAFMLMESGRADAIVSDDGLLYAAVASSKSPEQYVIGTRGLEFAPYGIVQPKDDPKFKALVDGAVRKLMADGTVAKLYDRYFMSPIPPNGINLKYPMSDALKKAISHPSDSSNPDDYKP